MLRIFGTATSPYVRRVCVIAHELELEHELVDTSTDAGQAALRERNPLWKIPSVELDGQLLFDSRVIGEELVARFAKGRITAPSEAAEHNAITVIDGALDSLINCFYFGRDGIGPEQSSYLTKQGERATSAVRWIEARVEAGWLRDPGALSLGEIALATAGAWMRFRATYPIDKHPALAAIIDRCEARPSFIATRPPGA